MKEVEAEMKKGREIKFRIWDNEDMLFFDDLKNMDFSDYCDFNKLMDRMLPLMQYTGLEDKNGKEIYEGDVVKILINNMFGDKQKNYIVCYDTSIAGFLPFAKGDSEGNNIIGLEVEIIGNIYENTELLPK